MRRGWIPAIAIMALGGGAGAASADVSVVSATVYGGPTGGVSHRTATHDQLVASGCPEYSGPNPLSLFGAHGAYAGQAQLSSGSTWGLGTIISCGLEQTASSLDSVLVLNPQSGYERPLSSKQLSDPGAYQDPGGPGALPVISNDGGENLNTYVRPWRGGGDDNEVDWVPSGPGAISLVVYENGAIPLKVSVIADAAGRAGSRSRYGFAARVADRSGQPVPASELGWSWSFGDGSATSSAPYPSHAFAPGRYAVSVAVSDAARGTGGTQTFELGVGDGSASGSAPQSGSGSTNPAGGSANGQQNPAPSPGTSGNSGTLGNSGAYGNSGAPATTTSSTIIKTITTIAGAPSAGHSGHAGHSHAKAPGHGSRAGHHPGSPQNAHALVVPVPTGAASPQTFRIPLGPEVSGRLISFDSAAPAAISVSRPLAPPSAAAAPVRRAVSQSPLVAAASAALALFVLTLGAAQELRLRPRRVAIVLRPVN